MVMSALEIEREPCWLDQVHGSDVVRAARYATAPRADAGVGDAGSPPCAVLTADCLPVVLCDATGTRVGIAHAGWRGLAGGVIERCVAAMERPAGELLAWLGPAIGAESYEVGPEVRAAFLDADPGAGRAFTPCAPDRSEGGPSTPDRSEGGPPAPDRNEGGPPAPDRNEGGPPASDRSEGGPPAPDRSEGGPPAPDRSEGDPPFPAEPQRPSAPVCAGGGSVVRGSVCDRQKPARIARDRARLRRRFLHLPGRRSVLLAPP